MKQVHPSYSFVASTKTITLTGLNIDQDQLLLIVNATRGVQYFNFADSSLRATVTPGTNTTVVLTDASTTGHANGDALVIYYDDQVTSQVVSGTVTANPGTGAFTVSGTVGLDNASLVALENITVTVGSSVALAAGSAHVGSVTVANFPSTQTIAGTVTANLSESLLYPNDASGLTKGLAVGFLENQIAQQAQFTIPNTDGSRPFPVAIVLNDGAGYANAVGNDINSSSLPISGTVTANFSNSSTLDFNDDPSVFSARGIALAAGDDLDTAVPLKTDGFRNLNVRVNAGSVTIGSLPAISGTVTARLQDASGNNLTSTSIGGVQRLNVSLASAATPGGALPSFVNVYGGSDSGTVRAVAVDSSGRSVVTVSNFPASTTVTVSALPNGALTTRFGSVTTANTAQITSAVTNTSRKYLLAQNISAGTVTIGIGFSPTTTQGIQLTAGGGLTFDAFCPTGAVYWLGAVTGAAYTILEG